MSFDKLTPESMLKAVEQATGTTLTGLVSPMSSYINRVYEIRSRDGEKLIVKFYRPGRWSREAILDEHAFVNDCVDAEIPVVAPLTLPDGTTLAESDSMYFAVFPKKAGRQLEITDDNEWYRLGMLVGRLHSCGVKKTAANRVIISPEKSTLSDCNYLYENVIPSQFKEAYKSLCLKLIDLSMPFFDRAEYIRLHGDLHFGNILNRLEEGLLLIDFDDMAMGPPVQDLWLLLPDHADKSRLEIELFIEGYEEFREFRRSSLKCIEPLRAMRMIYFLAWCSRQSNDYQFRKNFPDWGNNSFWQKEINDLQSQLGEI
jgi:Ser/Thr protein kinase RdoA (MazF antagonist)